MKPSLTDTLCTRCGLCCDGSLFADVELSGRGESTRLHILGLALDDDDADHELLLLPCAALKGRRCGIYAHRPECCRTFECRLLQDVRRGAVGVERARACIVEALMRIRRVKALLNRLRQRNAGLPLAERCADALAVQSSANPAARRTRAELEGAVNAVEEWIRKRFLAETGKIGVARRD